MFQKQALTTMIAPAVAALLLVGCGKPATDQAKAPNANEHGHDHHDGHRHGDHGPHGAPLIELGRGGIYHAEALHDEKAEVLTVHILDGKLKPHAVPTDSVAISLLVDGQGQTVALEAVEPLEGFASQFSLNDRELLEAIEEQEEDGAVQLTLTVDGKPYTGKLAHHDHHDHEHD